MVNDGALALSPYVITAASYAEGATGSLQVPIISANQSGQLVVTGAASVAGQLLL